jgi:fructokinase
MNPPPVIVGFGELLWDLLPAGPQLGGAPGNFAYHAHVLGAATSIVSAVGDDALGRRALDQLRGAGLSTQFITQSRARPTGTVPVTLDAAGQANYTIVENVAWDMIPESPDLLALAARADAVCYGSLVQRSPVSRATLRRFLAATRPECLRVFDINLRPPHFTREVVLESLATATLFKLNDEELAPLAAMLGCASDEASVFSHLFARYPVLQIIALTRGAQGATLVAPGERHDLPGQPPAQLADTIGAGDSFTAALVIGLLGGQSLHDCGTRAIGHASFVCSRAGAMPDMHEYLTRQF